MKIFQSFPIQVNYFISRMIATIPKIINKILFGDKISLNNILPDIADIIIIPILIKGNVTKAGIFFERARRTK